MLFQFFGFHELAALFEGSSVIGCHHERAFRNTFEAGGALPAIIEAILRNTKGMGHTNGAG